MDGSANNNKTTLILFFLIVVFACVAVFTSINQAGAIGPTALTLSADNEVVIALADRFVILQSGGALKSESKYSDIAVEGPVRDMQVLASGDFIIGDGGSHRLLRCDDRLRDCTPLSANTDVGKYHKFHVDEANDQIVLTHTEKHELWLLNLNGELIKTLIKSNERLRFPDGIYYLGNQHIVLADSFNKDIVDLNYSTDNVTINSVHNVNSEYVTGNRNMPVELSRTMNGTWWVATQSASLKDYTGSMLMFDQHWNPIGRVAHEAISQPVDMLSMGKWLLVADLEGIDIHAISQQGKLLQKYGDPALYQSFSEQRTNKLINGVLRYISIGALVILLVFGLIIENRRKKSEDKLDKDEPVNVELDGIIIDIPVAKYFTFFRMLPVLLILLSIFSGFLLYGSSPEYVKTISLLMFSIACAFFIMTNMITRRIPKLIEIASGKLTATFYNDKTISQPVSSISYTDTTLWLQGNYVLLGRNGALINNKRQYEQLKQLLSNAERITETAMQLRVIKREYLSYIILLLLLGLTAFTYFTVDKTDMLGKEAEIINELQKY